MSKKTKYFDRLHVYRTKQKNGLIRISVTEGWGFKDDVILAEFFVPSQEKDPFLVSTEVIRFRLKRDFGIEFGHHSTTMDLER